MTTPQCGAPLHCIYCIPHICAPVYDDGAGIIIKARAHSLLVLSGTQPATHAVDRTEFMREDLGVHARVVCECGK